MYASVACSAILSAAVTWALSPSPTDWTSIALGATVGATVTASLLRLMGVP